MNLYVLAGALRGNRKVARYLPSAAAARRRLLRKMDEMEMEQAELASAELAGAKSKKGGDNADVAGSSGGAVEESERLKRIETQESERKWSQIYSYSYSQSLTGCVMQLEQLQKYTKEICGEQGYVVFFSFFVVFLFCFGEV